MQTQSAEVVVIGGGAVGTAVTCFLARAGMDVALVERGEYAWGSSRRCDGHIATYDSPPGHFSRLCKLGSELFDVLLPELEYDIQLDRTGIAVLVDDEADLAAAIKNYEGKKAEGVLVEFWDRDELRHRAPMVADHVVGCLNFAGDGSLNPMRLAFSLADLAQKRGAKLYPRTTLTGIRTANGTVTGIDTNNGSFSTKKIVLAGGVWTPAMASMAGVSVPVRPRQGQILVTERQKGFPNISFGEFGYMAAKAGHKRHGVTSVMEDNGVALVFEPTAGGTIILGSSRRFVGMNTEPDPTVIKAIAQRAVTFFPTLGRANAIRSYAGLRPITPDGKPIISPTPVEGLYVATGHEGNGIGLSLVTGQLVAQMLSDVPPCIELEPLRLDRFKPETIM